VDQHEPDAVGVTPEALGEPVDSVAGQAEDGVDAPSGEAFDEEL
jgi:hypothetical protein